jgi:hypothetical protein
MKFCDTGVQASKMIRETIDKIATPLNDKTGLNAAKIVQDFANVWSRTDEPVRNQIQKAYNLKDAGTNSVNDLIKALTNGRIENIEQLKTTTEAFSVNGVLEQIKGMTERVVNASSNVKNLLEAVHTNEYRQMIKGAQYAATLGIGFEKVISTYQFQEWLGMIGEEFDGLMLNRDVVFKRNAYMDRLRADYADGYKKVETGTTVLKNKFESIVNNSQAIDAGLTSDAISKLMKNFDQDKAGKGDINLKKNIQDMIESGDLKKHTDESDDVAIKRLSDAMKLVYDEWKVFNYGVSDPDLQNYYKNWEDYRGSYLNHVISGGVDYVRAIVNGFESGEFKRDFVDSLSSTEQNMIQLFAKYVFKSDEEGLADFEKATGLDLVNKSFNIRKDYVPYLMQDSMRDLFNTSKGKSIPFADMLQERRDAFERDEHETNLTLNFVADLESFRSMMTTAHEALLARRMSNYMGSNDYSQWRQNHKFEDKVFKKYVKMTMLDDNNTEQRQTSKTVEMFRQTALAILGLENSVTLLGSGPKNMIQGMSTLLMNKSLKDWRSMRTGKLSIKDALSSNESIGDLTFSDVAESTKKIASNMISGRRAEIQILDALGPEGTDMFAKTLQGVFNWVETSNQYGMLAPLKFLSEREFNFIKEGPLSVMTNAGSEMLLRDWRKNEAFSWIGYEFHLDKAMIDAGKDDGTLEKKWSKKNVDNTVRQIMEKYKYDLYEKDNRYFGDFGKDTKPFWTHVALSEGDTIAKVALGFMGANWYMFRQAGNFGLITGLTATGRSIGEIVGGKSIKTNSATAMPLMTLGALILDQYNTFFADEYSMNIPLVSALNQMQDAGTFTKGVVMLTAPLFNMNMSKETADNIMGSLSRYGGGMFAGKTLESLYQDYEKDLPIFSTMFQSNMNYLPHLIEGSTGLFSAKTSEKFKEANDYINSAYQLTFPAIDNILGGNNDVLRVFINTANAFSSTIGAEFTNENDKRRFSEIRNRKWQKLIADMTGYNLLQVFSGRKAFNKKVSDVEMATYLKGWGLEESKYPGTYNVESLKEEALALSNAGGFEE